MHALRQSLGDFDAARNDLVLCVAGYSLDRETGGKNRSANSKPSAAPAHFSAKDARLGCTVQLCAFNALAQAVIDLWSSGFVGMRVCV